MVSISKLFANQPTAVFAAGTAAIISAWLLGYWAGWGFGSTFAMVAGAGILSLSVFAWTFDSRVIAPIREIEEGLERLGKGDPSMAFKVRGADEISRLASSAERVRLRMEKQRSGIGECATELSEKLGDMCGQAAQAATASRQQSGDALAMATVVEMMTYGMDSMAAQAEQVKAMSGSTRELSSRGAAVIQGAVAEIGKIAASVNASSITLRNLEKQSDEIGSIVQVIRKIAEQTNLLALNAAIEAARAGEQGRGFAVVADEVRKLAERTTESTQQIGDVIEKIQVDTAHAVESLGAAEAQGREGVVLAEQASEAISAIDVGISELSAAVLEISESLKEQAASNVANSGKVVELARVAEDNTVVIDEIAAAATVLDSTVTRVVKMMEEHRS